MIIDDILRPTVPLTAPISWRAIVQFNITDFFSQCRIPRTVDDQSRGMICDPIAGGGSTGKRFSTCFSSPQSTPTLRFCTLSHSRINFAGGLRARSTAAPRKHDRCSAGKIGYHTGGRSTIRQQPNARECAAEVRKWVLGKAKTRHWERARGFLGLFFYF